MIIAIDGPAASGKGTIARRLAQHNGALANGARYTRTRRPVKLAYQELAASRSAACKREYAIKQLTRREKLALIKTGRTIKA